MMNHYQAWNPDREDESQARPYVADTPSDAARLHSKVCYAAFGRYPGGIYVRDSEGTVTLFKVEAGFLNRYFTTAVAC